MKDRCYNQSNTGYTNYGARGIQMCARWYESFEAFLADMGPHPGPGYSLDRIDNNGNYEPGNCRWASRADQAGNRRTTRYVLIEGTTFNLAAAARYLGVEKISFWRRYHRARHEGARSFIVGETTLIIE